MSEKSIQALLHRNAGEVAKRFTETRSRRGCSTSVLPKNSFTQSAKFIKGADAPYPLCPVGHLPLFDFFEIVQREKDKRGPVS